MKTNILMAINSLVKNGLCSIHKYKTSVYRTCVNNLDEALESLVKDAFCDSLNVEEGDELNKIQSECFSYSGNQNNPPDLILKNGDAIEVKKLRVPKRAVLH